jgi:hypothetical protein
MLMFALLAIYPLARLFPDAQARRSHLLHRFIRGDAPAATYAFVAALCLLQGVPRLFPGDSALTGEGRMFAIHMFDAAIECDPYVMLRRLGGTLERKSIDRALPERIRCDPIVLFNRGRALCRSPERGTEFSDFDLYLNARKASDSALRPIIALQGFCETAPTYDLWRHNWWIHP